MSGCIIQRGELQGGELDAGPDVPGPRDAGRDAFDAPDTALDVGVDANLADAGPDAALDANLDVGFDDAGSDAGVDAAPMDDAGADAGIDAAMSMDAGSDAGIDAALDPDASVEADAAMDPDAWSASDAGMDAPMPDAFMCTAGARFCFNANTLSTCTGAGTFTNTSCPLGCVASIDGPAHCGVLMPTHVPATQLDLMGLADLSVEATQGLIFHTDTGQIQRRSTMGLVEIRATGVGLISGIDFALVPQASGPSIGSFGVASFNVAAGAFVTAEGEAALAILAQGAVVIDGTIDVGAVALVGGGPGGYDAEVGPGAGGRAELPGLPQPGGGGGGFGGRGGAGDDDTAVFDTRSGGAGGVTYGDAQLTVLQGGSGGGQGENGHGGGGGGAVQISSLVSITIRGVITAPGEGGRPDQEGAGGGGAGGGIFLEAPSVMWASPGILAVNGGGGGGGNTLISTSTAGERGRASTTAAPGGVSSLGDGRGGAGAAGATSTGGDGMGLAPSGGGGGGGGRVRILTLSGFAPMGLVASPEAAASAGRISVR